MRSKQCAFTHLVYTKIYTMLKKIINTLKYKICVKFRKVFIYPNNRKEEEGRTIICNNCTGAMMLHDLGYRLDTPTVNLWMNAQDYLTFANRLPDILYKDIVDITPQTSSYPIGLLDGEITLHFLHYDSFDDAITKWKRRASRVNMENIYLLLVDMKDDGIDLDFEAFEALPYKNKIAITYKEQIKFPHVVTLKYNPSKKILVTDFCNWLGKRYYDAFDFKSFLSNK